MDVSRALELAQALISQILSAVLSGQQTIKIEELGKESRQALDELKAYIDSLPEEGTPA